VEVKQAEITRLMEEMRGKGDQNEAANKTMTQNQLTHDLLVVELRKVPAAFIHGVVRNLKSKQL
jgi:hypothetical protein